MEDKLIHRPATQQLLRQIQYGAVVFVVCCTGCQALHPFTEQTRAKINSARNWANGGLEALQAGHLQRAQGFFQRATEQRPNDFRTRANLAQAHFQAGELESAVSEMQQAVTLSSNDPTMVLELGKMQLSAGDAQSARQQAESVLGRDRKSAAAWILQGQISRHQGDLKQAMAYLHKAAGLAPDNLEIQLELAKTYRANNEPLKALAAIDHLLAQHPIDAQPEQAILAKADILIQLDQSSTAIATLRGAMADRSKSEAIATKLIQAQLNAGKVQQANQSVQRLKGHFPRSQRITVLAEQIDDLKMR